MGFHTNSDREMIVQSSPFANSVAPFVPHGKQVVGEESLDVKSSPIPPVEESAQSAGTLNRKDPGDRGNLQQEQLRLRDSQVAKAATDGNLPAENPAVARSRNNSVAGAENQKPAEQLTEELSAEELRELAQLASRDRAVRAHEQAHVAVGGQFAGAASYGFKEGPDGLRYAVSGEVPINLGVVADDPQATLGNALQVQRAALAPADPSIQDRLVAARAAQVALEARSDIVQQQVEERNAQVESSRQEAEEKKLAEATRQEQLKEQEAQDLEKNGLKEVKKQNLDFNQRLLDVAVAGDERPIGTFLDQVI